MFFFDCKNNNYTFKPGDIEHAYLLVLQEDLVAAGKVFAQIDSPRAHWGITFTDILNGFLVRYPTYFEVRNFFEIDMDFLLKNEKIKYVEMMLGALDILSEITHEVYKYAARIMLENHLYNAAEKYLDKSKSMFYNDPELHFILAKNCLRKNLLEEADRYLKECLKIVPSYYPALKLKKDIMSYFDK